MALRPRSDRCVLHSDSYCGLFAAFALAVSVPISVERQKKRERHYQK